jgi:transcription elongation factor Elf1
MGKRKANHIQLPKKFVKLETRFKCPFCEDPDSVECKLTKKVMIAGIICHTCKANYKTSIDKLSEPIDVYHEWLDECERVNN